MAINLENQLNQLEKQMTEIKIQEEKIHNEIAENREKRKIKCSCDKFHQIKDLTLIQTHWYEEPYGCTNGDEWWPGELQFVCPRTKDLNRILIFVPYDEKDFKTNPEEQFKSKYKHHFKEIIQGYDNTRFHNMGWSYRKGDQELDPKEVTSGRIVNNHYVENNLKKFGLTRGKKDE